MMTWPTVLTYIKALSFHWPAETESTPVSRFVYRARFVVVTIYVYSAVSVAIRFGLVP